MATKRWRHLVTQTRAARDWRIPVTVMLGYRDDNNRWNDQDKIMAVALRQYEDSIHSCGVPGSVAFGDHNVGRVEWEEGQCHACASKEGAAESNKNNNYPGKVLLPVWDG